MHAGRRYTLKEFVYWTRRDIYILTAFAIVPTVLYKCVGLTWLALPWVPIALIGTAAAFLVGFRNTQTYNRVWEARQIYGSIVNTSRSFGMMVKDFIIAENNATSSAIHEEIIYRHIAWLTALRFQLRESRVWENIRSKVSNMEYKKLYNVPEWETAFEDEIRPFLSEADLQYILSKKNRATHLISLQSAHLKKLRAEGLIGELAYIELEGLLVNIFEQQGKCERIKNFPYPRQFATINQMFIRLFVSLIPYGTLGEFAKLSDKTGQWVVWLTIPFSVIIAWVFMAMERIGESTENPFEGGANDVPITAMSRTIEIDLREMLDEKDVPAALSPVNNILM
jgi:ion channel-forming bestrophin family protein